MTFEKVPVIRVLDFETGHPPVDGENGVIEVGFCDILAKDKDLLGRPTAWRISGDQFSTLVKINRPIEADHAAIHQIWDDDLALAPRWDEVLLWIGHVSDPKREIIAFAAYGFETEMNLLGDAGSAYPWICMFKIAVRLWPDAPAHSNQAIKHFLKMKDLPREELLPAHRALPDAKTTALHLLAALNGLGGFNDQHPAEQLMDWTTKPALLPRCRIGEWRGADGRGTPWTKVDSGMLDWITRKRTDPNEIFTANFHLEKRAADQREEEELRRVNAQLRQNGLTEIDSFGTNKPAANPFVDEKNGELPL